MAQISTITLPSGTTYDIKDSWARDQIADIVGQHALIYIGASSTELTDGGSELPTIDGVQVTPQVGNIFFYGSHEYIWGENSKWHEFGSLDTLGTLAYKNSASTTYTPTGTVSQPTFTGSSSNVIITSAEDAGGNYTPAGDISTPSITVKNAGTTTTINNPTKETVAKTVIAAAPGATSPDNAITYYSVSNENLSLYQLGYTTGDSITTNNVTVKTGDATYESSTPTFSGTKVSLTGTTTAEGQISQPTFSGTQTTITVT